jgi:hypothetical protein
MKLKKKLITVQIKRLRMPGRMPLKSFTAFYNKLISRYGGQNSLKVGYLDGYYSGGSSGYWLYERRLETDMELAKRQAMYDRRIAQQKAETVRFRRQRALEATRRKAELKRIEQAKMEKKVEEVKIMVSLLKSAGYAVSTKKVSKTR